MPKNILLFLVAAGLLSLQSPAFAHHGQAGYNNTEPVTVKGTVTDFLFSNPHSSCARCSGRQGPNSEVAGELTSPNHLLRAGWNAHSLKAGDQVTLTGFRAKSGANSLWITKTIVNGEELRRLRIIEGSENANLADHRIMRHSGRPASAVAGRSQSS